MKYFEVQPFDKRVYVTASPAEAARKHNSYADREDHVTPEYIGKMDGWTAHVVNAHKKPHSLFLIYMDLKAHPGVWYHEALHLTHDLMEYCGMEISGSSSELQAYTMEHIVKLMQEKLYAKPKQTRHKPTQGQGGLGGNIC